MHTKITCTRPATNRLPQSSVIGGGAHRLFPLPADGIRGHWWALRGGAIFCSVTGTHVRDSANPRATQWALLKSEGHKRSRKT